MNDKDRIAQLEKENLELKRKVKMMVKKYNNTLEELKELNSVAGKIAQVYKREDRLGIDTDEVVNRYLGGETPYKIAKSYNCNIGTIINRLKNKGVYKNNNIIDF